MSLVPRDYGPYFCIFSKLLYGNTKVPSATLIKDYRSCIPQKIYLKRTLSVG